MGEVNHGVLDKLDQANKTLSEKYAHFWNAAIKYITFFLWNTSGNFSCAKYMMYKMTPKEITEF